MPHDVLDRSLADRPLDLDPARRALAATCGARIVPYSEWRTMRTRKTHLGASEVGTLLGVSPWQTRHELWRRKQGLAPPTQTTSRMLYGTHMEPLVLQWYADALPSSEHLLIASNRTHVVHCTRPSLDWATCSPDGVVATSDGVELVEVKTTQREGDLAMWAALGNRPPDLGTQSKIGLYWLQIVWQQIVCRVHRTRLVVAHGTEWDVYTIETDAQQRKFVGRWVAEEYRRVIVEGHEPPALGPDLAALGELYPPETQDPAPTLDDPVTIRLAEELAEIQAQTSTLSSQRRPLDERAKNLRALLAQRMGRDGLAYVGEYEIRRSVTTVTPEPYTRHDVRMRPRTPGPAAPRVEEIPAAELYEIPDVDRLVAYLAEREAGETQSALAKICAPGVLEEAASDSRLEARTKGRGTRWYARTGEEAQP